MIRNLKVLALALGALFAMSAMVASAASAAEFTAGSDEITITGKQATNNNFKVTKSEISCGIATFHGVIASSTTKATSATVTPTYTECEDTVFHLTAKVTGFGHYGEGNNCDYVLQAAGTADLVCKAGTDVTVDAGTCIIHIPGQTGIGTVSYANGTGANGKEDVTVTLNINNIKGTHTDGFICPFEGGGSFTNGALTGTVTVEADDVATGNPVNITWDK